MTKKSSDWGRREFRPVTLELVRPGPAHNQLLSPLTPYLALCDDHPAEIIHFPFEHAELLRELDALRYTREGWQHAAERLTRKLTDVLLGITSLTRALVPCDDEGIELRLLLSATELALLPFELVTGPTTDLCLVPMVVVRRARREVVRTFELPYRARILLAASGAGGPVPLPQVALAVREAMEPWTRHDGMRLFRDTCTIVTNATVTSIGAELTRGQRDQRPYTHVLVLAHGREQPAERWEQARVGLALDGATASAPADLVDGQRLAVVLQTDGRAPSVVVLLTCEGGSPGGVLTPGGSVAHALHDAGIPMVVASQFPLTFGAATQATRTLLRSLQWGRVPAKALLQARAELYSAVRRDAVGGHDWASIVCYAVRDSDSNRRQHAVRYWSNKRALDALMACIDDTNDHTPGAGVPGSFEELVGHFAFYTTHLTEAAETLQRMDGTERVDGGRWLADCANFLAAHYVNLAEATDSSFPIEAPEPGATARLVLLPDPAELKRRHWTWREWLRKARAQYDRVTEVSLLPHTAVARARAAVLSAFLDEGPGQSPLVDVRRDLETLDRSDPGAAQRGRVELDLLEAKDPYPPGQPPDAAELRRLREWGGYSLRRSLRRFRHWLKGDAPIQAVVGRLWLQLAAVPVPTRFDGLVAWNRQWPDSRPVPEVGVADLG